MLVPNRSTSFRIVHRSPSAADALIIFASLVGFLGVIASLGALEFGVGLNIGPIGEDYNWIDILQRGPGAQAARFFWEIDHRNPLSPWWYIAARNLILSFDSGLLVLRYAISTILAFSSYVLVITVAGRGARPFALALAVLITFWMANRYTDQIIWNFQGALAASMLSVAAYAQFITKARRPYHLYGLSLVFWFFAFGTYTIQSGAVVAIAYLALRDALSRDVGYPSNSFTSLFRRLGRGILDLVPYAALFGLFVLIWQTTMGPLADAVPLKFNAAALFQSLKEGLVNGDLLIFYNWIWSVPHPLVFIAAAGICAAALCLVLQLHESRLLCETPGVTWRTLIDLLVVFAGLALPTVLLESSSQTWGPGTRWPMIYQVTTPVLIIGAIAGLILAIRRTWGPRLWKGAIALAVGIGALFSLNENWIQNQFVSHERFVRDGLQRLVAEDSMAFGMPPKQVLVMLDGPARQWWRSADVVSPTIARVWLHGLDTSFRLVPWSAPFSSGFQSWWRIRFGSDAEGIANAKVWGGAISYNEVAILHVNGRTASRVTRINREDLTNWDIEWARDGPVILPSYTSRDLCPIRWSADQAALLNGWGDPERDGKGPIRWTVSRAADLTLPATCGDSAYLRVTAAYAVSMRSIEKLTLRINGRTLPYTRTISDGNILYEALLDPRVVAGSPLLRVEFGVDAVDTVPGVGRQLGVAIRTVEILPSAAKPSAAN